MEKDKFHDSCCLAQEQSRYVLQGFCPYNMPQQSHSLLWTLIRTTLRAGDYLSGHLSSLLSLTIPGTICYSFLTCTSLHTQWCYDLPLPLVIFVWVEKICLYLLLYCSVNIMAKATRIRKGFFCFTIPHCRLSFRKGKARAEAETIKKSCLPAYSPGSRSAGFPMPFRTICLRVVLATVGLDLSISIIHQELPTRPIW